MSIERKQPRPKKCRVAECRASFVPARLGQAVCSPTCAILDAPANREKARKAIDQLGRKEIKVRKEKLKSRAEHLKDTQIAFNAWVRERDAELPCISCGRHHQGKYDAGHYRTVGSNPALRFEPLNCHRQCSPCNTQLSGNIVNYRIALVKRIGADAVDWLEGPHEAKKYTVEELKAMTADYRAKNQRAEGESGMTYRNVVSAVVRALAAETINSAGGCDFEPKVQCDKQKGEIVGKEAAFLTDCWVFGRLHKALSAAHWRALVAKYSTHDERKHGAILELIKTAQSPAPQRFRECAVLTWAIPQVAGVDGKRSAALLPAAWYDITNWDNDGKPESTRYRWRSNIRKALDDQVNEALTAAQELLDSEGLIESCAA